ncbi:MAG TPA: hydroxymethylbilane synthase [Candidatus Dormibacteraeota bacterium]|nr:hydroxymethylbilane synthase [Candidatus Dormibacteraeota bacterium]
MRLRIGTRGSALALWQANFIADRLKGLSGLEIEIVRIRTSGDHMQTAAVAKPLAEYGAEAISKGIFIKELEDALLNGTVDLAVHSMKDVPTDTPAQLAFPAITQREDPRDCLISRQGRTLKTLPHGARVGTSSLRRQAQLRHRRPDLELAELRGNVDTRIKKLEAGEYDAIILAMAGVNRLGLAGKITQVLDEEIMLPAVGQGALGIETRADDAETSHWVAHLDHPETRACVTAERAVLRALQGGCQIPLGALAHVRGEALHLEAAVFSARGSEHVQSSDEGPVGEADAIGARLGAALIEAGADNILRLAGRTIGQGS